MRGMNVRVGFDGLLSAIAIAATAVFAGCSEETTSPGLEREPGVIVANTRDLGTVYLKLGDSAEAVTVADPATSTEWDIAIAGLEVRLNGGAHAASDVAAYCICENENLSNAELQALTAEGELEAFKAVDASSVPVPSAFEEDALVPAITGWYNGQPGSGATANATYSWVIRKGTSTPIFSKFRVTALQGAAASGPSEVTIEYATQPSSGAAFNATSTANIDLASGPVYFSFASGVVTAADAWDLLFDGWVIRVNGGVSGNGGISAVSAESYPFNTIDAAFAASIPSAAYSTDAYGGVFASHPWYRYNLTGTDHQIWPTYDIYLIRRGNEVFKIQFIGYYNEAGQSGNVTLRYARVGR